MQSRADPCGAAPVHPPRFLPEMPLPPYAHVPGRTPHPESDPAGHSFGLARPEATPVDPERWRGSREYLRGLDLFNHGFYWEAHEQWEALWHAAGRRGRIADFLKGLIKLAASGVKHLEGVPAGSKGHAQRAAELWREVARGTGAEADLLGLRLGELIALGEQVGRDGWPGGPVILAPGGPPQGLE
jgi:hypothetical protein